MDRTTTRSSTTFSPLGRDRLGPNLAPLLLAVLMSACGPAGTLAPEAGFAGSSTDAPVTRETDRPNRPPRIAGGSADIEGPDPPASAAPRGEALWAKRLGGEGTDMGVAVAIDGLDNLFVAGQFIGTTDLGNARTITSKGLEDIFLVKMSPRGQVLWARVFQGPGHDYANDVAVDEDGNAYLTGAFTREISIGERTHDCRGVHDIFVAKVSPAGEVLWSRAFGDRHDQISLRAEAAPGGGVFLAGWFRGNVRPARKRHGSYPDKAIFVALLDGNGKGVWSDSFGHVYDYADPGLVPLEDGGLFLAAGSDPTRELTGKKFRRVDRMEDLGLVLARYGANGRLAWRKLRGGGSSFMSARAAPFAGGDIAVAGTFGGYLDLGESRLEARSRSDLFIARLTGDGAPLWRFTGTGSRFQSIAGVAVSTDSTVFATGQFEGGPLRLGDEVIQGNGYMDIFVAAFSGDGAILWSRAFGDDQIQWPGDMVVDSAGNPVIVGAFAGSVDFGNREITSAGGHDVFVVKLRP